MSTLKVQLDRIDLSTDSRNTLTALIELLAPHVPYSLQVLGTILNAAPRASTLQSVDPSKVTLWSTIPIRSDTISTTDVPGALFSIVTFSHLDYHFRFSCSSELSASDPPTEAKETHVKQVFEHLRDIARDVRPTYNSTITVLKDFRLTHRIDTDPPTIAIWAIHAKWAHVLAPMSMYQHPGVRYAFPPGTFEHDVPLAVSHWTMLRGGDDSEVEVSQIRASDLSFVYGASGVPRSEAYILSRVPYSVCLRSRGKMGADEGQPVACVLMHSDGSIGALHVDPKHQRQGLGRLVVRALTEKLDFSKGQGELDLIPEELRDLGGGALGWNWTDTEARNEAGNRFFASLGGKEGRWMCHIWACMLVDRNQ